MIISLMLLLLGKSLLPSMGIAVVVVVIDFSGVVSVRCVAIAIVVVAIIVIPPLLSSTST